MFVFNKPQRSLTSIDSSRTSQSSSAMSVGLFVKCGILGTFFVVCAILSGSSLSKAGGMFLVGSYALLINAGIYMACFVALSALCALCLHRQAFRSVILFLGGVAFALGFLQVAQIGGLAAVVLFGFTCLIIGEGAWRSMRNMVSIGFFGLAKTISSHILLCIVLLTSYALYVHLVAYPLKDSFPLVLSEKTFTTLTALASRSVGPLFGGVDFSKSVEQIAEQEVASQTASLSPAVKKMAMDKVVTVYQQKFSEQFGVVVNIKQTLGSLVYKAIIQKLIVLDESQRPVIVGVVVGLFFVSLATIIPVCGWIIGGIVALLLFVLKAFGFITIGYKDVSKEELLMG